MQPDHLHAEYKDVIGPDYMNRVQFVSAQVPQTVRPIIMHGNEDDIPSGNLFYLYAWQK